MIVQRNIKTAAPTDTPAGERHVLEVEGCSFPVVVAGEGPAVLFVHGLGHDMGDWSELFARRPAHLSYLALDLPGFGEAEIPNPLTQLDLGLMVKAIRAAADLVKGDTPPVVVGSSLGGHLAMLAALEGMPVSGLFLLSPGGLEPFPPELQKAALTFWSADAICARTEVDVLEANQRLFVTRTPRIERMLNVKLARHRSPYRREMAEVIEQVVHGVMSGVVIDRIAELPRPVEVLWGEADVLVPRRGIDELCALDGVTLRVLERTGHLPMFEQPDLVTDHLTAFCDRQLAGAPRAAAAARLA